MLFIPIPLIPFICVYPVHPRLIDRHPEVGPSVPLGREARVQADFKGESLIFPHPEFSRQSGAGWDDVR